METPPGRYDPPPRAPEQIRPPPLPFPAWYNMDPDAPPMQLTEDHRGFMPSQWLEQPMESAELIEEPEVEEQQEGHTETTEAETVEAPLPSYTDNKLAEGEKQAEIAAVIHEPTVAEEAKTEEVKPEETVEKTEDTAEPGGSHKKRRRKGLRRTKSHIHVAF